jgi:hypothetical protein
VNQSFAREFWPNASALGKRIAWRDFGGTDGPRWMTIVGVALDVKSRDLVADDTRAVYTPYVQRRVDWQRFGTLVVRSGVLPSALTPSVKKAVWSVDPTLPLERVATLQERRVRSSAQQRFNAAVVEHLNRNVAAHRDTAGVKTTASSRVVTATAPCVVRTPAATPHGRKVTYAAIGMSSSSAKPTRTQM